MPCPSCSRKRFREKIIKKAKRNFLVQECLGCQTQYGLLEVRKSKLTNTWIEVDKEDKEDK